MSRSKSIFRGSIAGPLPGYLNSQSCKAPRSSAFCWISFILFFIATRSCAASPPSESLKNTLDGIIRRIQNRDQTRNSLTQPPLALPQSTSTIIENSKVNSDLNHNRKFRRKLSQKCNSVKTVSSVQLKANQAKEQIRNILRYTGSTGFYYGIDLERMIPNGSRPKKPRPPKLEDSMALALDELKTLRLEMERMSSEIRQLKRKMIGDDTDESSYYIDDNLSAESKEKALRKRRKEAEKLAAEIESWATAILDEGEEDGWTPVECSKMIRASVNGMERTTAFMKWMVDSRAEKADKEDQAEHPCIKCSSTIDAPLELVCTYLSQPDACPLYNDVVDKFEDLEEISPNAKICWSSSPQILFVKPRDFVTFCHHRWKADGTEVIVNQACEHPKFPLNELEKKGKSCRGYALRGANFISRCSDDPSKTKITIVAHCRPGGGLPDWATKTAVKALAPIEPFKLFHKINEQVTYNQDKLQRLFDEGKEKGAHLPPGRTSRPGGFAQIGYACFWPNGGGKQEQTTSINDFSKDHEDALEYGENSSISAEIDETTK